MHSVKMDIRFQRRLSDVSSACPKCYLVNSLLLCYIASVRFVYSIVFVLSVNVGMARQRSYEPLLSAADGPGEDVLLNVFGFLQL